MKFSSEVKKSFTDNHRRNYAAYNKSSIFEPVQPIKPDDSRNLIKMQSKSAFVPKLKEETPFNRKLKEFWSKDEYLTQYGTKNSTRGFIQKEYSKANEEHMVNQKKVFENESLIEKQEGDKNVTKAQKNNSSENEEKKVELSKLKCAKERRLSELNSNIFNENNKVMVTKHKSKPLSLNEDYFWDCKTKTLPTEKKKEKNPLGTNFDWLNVNSEVIFNSSKTPSISSAKEMKLNNLFSHFDSEEKRKSINLRLQKEEGQDKLNHEGLQEKFSSHKLVRLSSLTSSFNDKNFLKNNYEKKDKKERDVDNYEVIMKQGFDKTETKKIKAMFTNQGIHVYDFKETLKVLGSDTGSLEFKLRKNDDEGFSNKMKEINDNMSKVGIEINKVSKNKNNHKPMYYKNPIFFNFRTELVPSGINWNDQKYNQYTNKRIIATPKQEEKNTIAPSE